MIETRPSAHHRWYDDSWDWAVVSFLVLVLLAGIAVWGYAGNPHTATADGRRHDRTGQPIEPDDFPAVIGSATTSHPRFGGDFFAMTSGRTTDLERIPLA